VNATITHVCAIGYGKVKGHVLQGPQLRELIDGLEENGLLNYTHVLTGTTVCAVV
jgi:pyridoxal/pyridoxine/pyridoxamine kinase